MRYHDSNGTLHFRVSINFEELSSFDHTIVNARTCASAIAIPPCRPGVENTAIGEVVKPCILHCLRILLLSEVADLSGVAWEVKVETWSHPVVGIPKDHAGIRLG